MISSFYSNLTLYLLLYFILLFYVQWRLQKTMHHLHDARSKKRSQDEASVSETPPAARYRVDSGAEMIRYITKAKNPSIPLPDAFDGNLKHLKKFLSELDLWFRVAPSKYAEDNAKSSPGGGCAQTRRCTYIETPG